MVSGVLSGVGSVVFFVQQESLEYINPNAWSFFPLTSLFVACVYFASPAQRRRARLLVGLALVNAGWVFLSGSRGSMLICAVCLLFILARLPRVQGNTLSVAAAVLVVVAIAGQLVGQKSQAVSRLTKWFDSDLSLTEKTSGRLNLALGGWRIFLDHPMGVGTGGFPKAWASLLSRREMSSDAERQAHSGWIKVLAENGIPGILLFAAVVLSFAVLGWRRKGAGMFLPGLLVTVALSVAFVADEFQGKGLWYLFGAMMLFMRRSPGRKARVRAARGDEAVAGSLKVLPVVRGEDRPVAGTGAGTASR
jgi:O-antigen ligase